MKPHFIYVVADRGYRDGGWLICEGLPKVRRRAWWRVVSHHDTEASASAAYARLRAPGGRAQIDLSYPRLRLVSDAGAVLQDTEAEAGLFD